MRERLLNGLLALPFLLLAGAPLRAQLLVVNQTPHTLSFVDPAGKTPTQSLDVAGVTGHEVAVTPDGRTAFVPVYGNSGVGKSGTDGQLVQVIDVASRKIVHTIDFGHGVRPHCAVYDRKRNLLYVTAELDQAIAIIDPRTYQIVGKIPTGQAQSHMLTLSHDGRFGYTANVGPGTVSVLDLEKRTLLKVIPISGNTQRISITNDDAHVFTADQTKPQLAVVDPKTLAVTQFIALPGIGYGTTPTPDGRWLLIALRSSNKVAMLDLATLKVVRTLDTPKMPTEILVRPDGKFAYVSCSGTNQVATIDLSNWTLGPLFATGDGDDGLAWVR
jgi:DNA-binding beta-propeller fold protein YncE